MIDVVPVNPGATNHRETGERDFVNQRYNDIRKVYTIWICMDAGEDCVDHIHLTKDNLLGSHKWKGRLDLLNIFLIGLGDEVVESDNEDLRLHRLEPDIKYGVIETCGFISVFFEL